MTQRDLGRFLLPLLTAAVLVPLAAATALAGACDIPSDPNPHPKQIPNCEVQTSTPISFTELQHQYWSFSCTGRNSLFLGNDDGWSSSGYALDNNCFSTMTWQPQFQNQFDVTLINWCDKDEQVKVSLGCMPDN